MPAPQPSEVADLIRLTDHAQQHTLDHPPKDLMLGVDLAILGQSAAIYKIYTESVRAEYAWVEEPAYRAGRKAVLQQFVAAMQPGTLYVDPYFQDLYETTATFNLKCEMAGL